MKKNSGILTFFLSIFIFGFLIFKPAFGQDASLLPNAVQQFFDANGNPLSSGKVYFYQVGTSAFKDVYNSSAATTPYTNPITLNAGGKPPGSSGIYGIGLYRQIVKDKNGNTIWDAVTAPGGGSGGTPTNIGDGNAVGTVLPWSGLIAPSQYVFTYGQELIRTDYPEFYSAITLQTNVICTASSNTLTGISDTSQIPVGADIELSLCVPPGSTVISKTSGTVTLNNPANVSLNATARFFPYGNGDGSTTFNVPDLRDVVLAGRPNMGGSDRGLITSTYFGTNPAALGALGGSQSHTQTISEMAMHSHNNTLTDPGHSHDIKAYGDETSNDAIAAGGVNLVNTVSTITAATGITITNAIAGSSSPFTIIQPTLTFNYIIKVTPDTPMSTETIVTKLGGMTGVISCGIGLTCSNQMIAVNSFGEATTAIKIPVKVATTANIGLFGAQTIDGISVISGDRTLVKDQFIASENGIYIVSNSNWVRASDFNENGEVIQGTTVIVTDGNTNKNHIYTVITPDPIMIGITSIYFDLLPQFINNGASAILRTYQSKERDFVSVLDYDATTAIDQTAAFQAAINYASSSNKAVYCAPRDTPYLITNQIDIPSNTYIYGNCQIKRSNTSTATSLFRIAPSADNITIRDIECIGNKTINSNISSCIRSTEEASNLQILNTKIHDFTQRGIYTGGSTLGTNGLLISNNLIYDNNDAGIAFKGTNFIIIGNQLLRNGLAGITTSGAPISNGIIANNVADSNAFSSPSHSDNFTAYDYQNFNISFIGNISRNSVLGHGYHVAGTGVSFIGNTAENNYGIGIYISNKGATSGVYASNATIIGNIIRNSIAGDGIRIEKYRDVNISGNTSIGNPDAQILAVDSENIIIANNIVKNGSWGIQLQNIDDATIIANRISGSSLYGFIADNNSSLLKVSNNNSTNNGILDYYYFASSIIGWNNNFSSIGNQNYILFPSQSTFPISPSTGFNLYANSGNNIAWVAPDGFIRTLRSENITSNRSWILPDAPGTFVVSASSPLNLNNITGDISITGAAGSILAGSGPIFTPTPTLGISGSTLGNIKFANTTSGLITLQPSSGDLGTSTAILPIGSGTLASLGIEGQILEGGAMVVEKSLGSISSGTITPDSANRPMQIYTNNGNHVLAPSSNIGQYTITIINGVSAGIITTSSWTKVIGDAFDTINGHKFICVAQITSGGSLLSVTALQ